MIKIGLYLNVEDEKGKVHLCIRDTFVKACNYVFNLFDTLEKIYFERINYFTENKQNIFRLPTVVHEHLVLRKNFSS